MRSPKPLSGATLELRYELTSDPLNLGQQTRCSPHTLKEGGMGAVAPMATSLLAHHSRTSRRRLSRKRVVRRVLINLPHFEQPR